MNETQIRVSLEYLANLCLVNSGVHREYTDENLSDAMLIFMEVFMAKMYTFQKEKGLTQEQLETLAEEAGKSLHQTTLLFTGVDFKKVYPSNL